MTDRLKGFVVTLVTDIREDDAEAIQTALRMVKGVLMVQPLKNDPGDMIIENRVLAKVTTKLYDLAKSLYD